MPNWWGKLLYLLSAWLVRVSAFLVFRLRIKGCANVPRRGPLLVACNHVSHLDPPIVGASVPRMIFNMAKKELFRIKILHWYMSAVGTIMVDRGRGSKAVDDAIQRIRQGGGAVLIFPEGTRSTDGRLMKGRAGAVVIAIRSGCTIVPAAISGSERAMTKGSKRIRSVPVSVSFGQPYKIDYDGDINNIPREVLERECWRMMESIEELLPERMKPDPQAKQSWYAGQKDELRQVEEGSGLVSRQPQG